MDLSTLDTTKAAEEGATIMLKFNGDQLFNVDAVVENGRVVTPASDPMTIDIVGSDSETFKKAQRVVLDKRLAQQAQQRGRRGPKPLTAEQIETEDRETLAAAVRGWNITVDGAKPAFSRDTCIAVLKRFPWVAEQLDEEIADRANFLKGSAKG